jgi:CubicO group peptidase (beta-lactamase class C family)
MKLLFLLLMILNFLPRNASAYDWSEVSTVINKGLEEKLLPGAVLLVGNKTDILFQEAFGNIDAENSLNTTKTLYDLASLTKVVATTTSIMLLEEQGKLSLQDKITKFFPEFTGVGKEDVTIEQVLRHESGLAAWQGPLILETFENYLSRFLQAPLSYIPGSKFVYSDLGFILLAQVVEKISKLPIGEFAKQNIFLPLEMNSTYYHVPAELNVLCAPTFKDREKCLPHDPISFRFSPLELGHAGLFSTAENLSHLIQMYLNLGKYKNARFLKEETVNKMITLPPNKMHGLGFDLLSPYTDAPRGQVFPKGISYGHTGYTGTTIWVDPVSGGFLIFLSNRVLSGEGSTAQRFFKLRNDISTAIGKQFYPN